MLNVIDSFRNSFLDYGIDLITPEVTQTLTVEQLCEILPECDGWIAGDDPGNHQVLTAGKMGSLRVVVKWGVGTDNIDINACKMLGIDFCNTPDVFGKEVADVALGYCIALSRQLGQVDRAVRSGNWLKHRGLSLENKKAAVVGYGSVGKELVKRLTALDMRISVYDPNPKYEITAGNEHLVWPNFIEKMDFIFLVCPLNSETYHLVNESILRIIKPTAFIINVSRGPIIDEVALIESLKKSQLGGVALDVFETEPPDRNSYLLKSKTSIFGSHNSSNTDEAVRRASILATQYIINSLCKEAI